MFNARSMTFHVINNEYNFKKYHISYVIYVNHMVVFAVFGAAAIWCQGHFCLDAGYRSSWLVKSVEQFKSNRSGLRGWEFAFHSTSIDLFSWNSLENLTNFPSTSLLHFNGPDTLRFRLVGNVLSEQFEKILLNIPPKSKIKESEAISQIDCTPTFQLFRLIVVRRLALRLWTVEIHISH